MQHSLQAGSVAGAECSLRQCPRAQRPRASCTMHAIRRQGLAMRATSSGLLQRASRLQRRQQQRLDVQATYPEPETEKERSPIDYPQEWITPQPSRRPDIFPEFEKLQTPLPKPMPGDPEMPDEEEEEEKEKKPDKEDDPEKEETDPDKPAPSEE